MFALQQEAVLCKASYIKNTAYCLLFYMITFIVRSDGEASKMVAGTACGPTYKFGIRIPKNRKDALPIDSADGNTCWKISMDTEVEQIDEYDTFQDLGKGRPPPRNHQKIRLHFI